MQALISAVCLLISPTEHPIQFHLQPNVRGARITVVYLYKIALFTVLSRLQAFLPQLEASNAELARRAQADPSSVDIENIPEGAEQYIEMVRIKNMISISLYSLRPSLQNLGLGVFEDRSNQEDVDMSDTSSDSSDSSSNSESSSSDDDDSDSSSETNSSHPTRPIKPLPRRPEIVELSDTSLSTE